MENAQGQNNDELLAALKKKNLAGACAAIRSGANVNGKEENGRTALHLAAALGSLEGCKFLLEEGAEVDVKDDLGLKPLDFACSQMHVFAAAALIAYGAQKDLAQEPDESFRNTLKLSEMQAAVIVNFAGRVLQLLEAGRDPKDRGELEASPAEIAARPKSSGEVLGVIQAHAARELTKAVIDSIDAGPRPKN